MPAIGSRDKRPARFTALKQRIIIMLLLLQLLPTSRVSPRANPLEAQRVCCSSNMAAITKRKAKVVAAGRLAAHFCCPQQHLAASSLHPALPYLLPFLFSLSLFLHKSPLTDCSTFHSLQRAESQDYKSADAQARVLRSQRPSSLSASSSHLASLALCVQQRTVYLCAWPSAQVME